MFTDTRKRWENICHKLVDIVFMGPISVTCTGTDFEHMEVTGSAKPEWFRKIPEFPNRLLDGDTF